MAERMSQRSAAYGWLERKEWKRTSRQVLLVREYEQQTFLHFSVAQYPVKFLLRLVYPLTVLAVDYEHQALCPGVVVSPEWPNLVLASHVPYVEAHILICHRLDVEPD